MMRHSMAPLRSTRRARMRSRSRYPGVYLPAGYGVDEGDEHIASTDADGKICWEGLLPQDYVITEIKTADGKNLLKDNITVTLPMELTVEEAQQRGADLSQAVWDEAAQKYCFYDLTLKLEIQQCLPCR